MRRRLTARPSWERRLSKTFVSSCPQPEQRKLNSDLLASFGDLEGPLWVEWEFLS